MKKGGVKGMILYPAPPVIVKPGPVPVVTKVVTVPAASAPYKSQNIVVPLPLVLRAGMDAFKISKP
jgi:hypothetical protein